MGSGLETSSNLIDVTMYLRKRFINSMLY